VPYVPTAALLARRRALPSFDEALRYGEDVDLLWRLHDDGLVVRYEPAVLVHHHEPTTWRAVLSRQARYGTSAGPLAERHPERLAPAVVRPITGVAVAGVLAGRPEVTAGAFGWAAVSATRQLGRLGVPPTRAVRRAVATLAAGIVGTTRPMVSLGWPVLTAAAVRWPRTRPWLLATVLAAPLHDHVRRRPDLDLPRSVAATLADDLAYGAGVWAGSLSARTIAPLCPVSRGWDGIRRRAIG
jgi:mycofactocin glycosyltransferase